MHTLRQDERLILTFNFLESSILRKAFSEIVRNYKTKPDELDPKLASVWYSTRGCKSAGMSHEETQEWLASLHQFKSANLQRLNTWHQALAPKKSGVYQLDVSLPDAQALLTVLNDHRLLMAARYDIGQQEMDMRSSEAIRNLTRNQQTALFAIHLLACIIEELINHISPEAGSWIDPVEQD